MKLTQWIGRRINLRSSGFWGAFYGGTTWANKTVTPGGAMQLSAVYRSVRLTSETVASLSPSTYLDTDRGPELLRGGDTDKIIRLSPNAEQTPLEFWEQIIGCMELVGEGFARKHWNATRTRVVALTVLDPTRMSDEDRTHGAWFWRYRNPNGREEILEQDDVLHVPGFRMGGRRGFSTVTYGAQTMALALAAEETAGKLFASGLRNSGFLQTQAVFDDTSRPRMQKIMDQYMGSANAGGLMILEGGMEFKPMNMSAQDAELLLTRKFEIEEIGRWFGLPPILLGHAVEGQTMWGSGVDSILQSWMTLGLRQRLVRVQQVIDKRLRTASEKAEGQYTRYNPDALLAVNSEARMRFLNTAVGGGIMKPNEARDRLELPNEPGGEQLLVQANLVPLAQIGQNSGQSEQIRAALRTWLISEDKPHADDPST